MTSFRIVIGSRCVAYDCDLPTTQKVKSGEKDIAEVHTKNGQALRHSKGLLKILSMGHRMREQ